MTCEKCGGQARFGLLLLEVQTLHIRDLNGERRVQALGGFVEAGVCDGCVREAIRADARPQRRLVKQGAGCLLLFLGGLAAALLLREAPLRIFGVSAMLCAVCVLLGTVKKARAARRAMAGKAESELLREYAFRLLSRTLPQKSGDSDLTYIDVTDDFLTLPPQTLVERYDLMPQLARRALELAAARGQAPDPA